MNVSFFKVLDTITNAETAQKRFVTAIASSFLLGGLTTLVSYVYNKINERAGTTLALENCSNKKLPIVLEDPRYSLYLLEAIAGPVENCQKKTMFGLTPLT